MSESSSPLYGPDGNHVTVPEEIQFIPLRPDGFKMPFHPSMTQQFLAERCTDGSGQFMVPAQVLLAWLETYHALEERDVTISALSERIDKQDGQLSVLVERIGQLERAENPSSREADKP